VIIDGSGASLQLLGRLSDHEIGTAALWPDSAEGALRRDTAAAAVVTADSRNQK
jgi:hypothetical protein